MICEKNKCTGCSACYNICPKNAIEMVEDDEGYIYPKIDKEKCISCKLCEKVCPGINDEKDNFKKVKKCYSAYAKHNEIQEKSTSGGIAYILSRYFINNNGIVYGAFFYSTTQNVEHLRCDNEELIKKLRGSKYIQSNIKSSYTMAKKDLDCGKKVLFIGTPCQISGLKHFLNFKDYDNLFTIDLICHGVSSKKILNEDIKSQNIEEIKFRDGLDYCINYKDKNGEEKKITLDNSIFLNFFLKSYLLRPSCDECRFSNIERISDISLGDFWHLKDTRIDKNIQNKGVSMVLVNSDKGEELLKFISDSIVFFEEDLKVAQKFNEPLNKKNTTNIKKKVIRTLGKLLGVKKIYKISNLKRRIKVKNDK